MSLYVPLSKGTRPWEEIDLDTGVVTYHPGGGRGGGGSSEDSEDFKHALLIIKNAAEIKDHELRKTVIRASGEYLAKDRLLGPAGTIVLVMEDDRIRPLKGAGGGEL